MQAESITARRRSPANKGRRYPADPPRVEEIIAVMKLAGERPHGLRLRGLIVVLWRAGLRIAEALALSECDLDPSQGALLVRAGRAGVVASLGWTIGGGSSFGPGSSTGANFRSARCFA